MAILAKAKMQESQPVNWQCVKWQFNFRTSNIEHRFTGILNFYEPVNTWRHAGSRATIFPDLRLKSITL